MVIDCLRDREQGRKKGRMKERVRQGGKEIYFGTKTMSVFFHTEMSRVIPRPFISIDR
jgi:hypothetical protein